jgi:hypothetical protein
MNYFPFALALLAAGASSCQRTTTQSQAPGTTLVGTWKLTAYQCHCPPNQPVPDESVTLDASQHFKLYRKGALAAEGTYTTGEGVSCGGGASEPIITLTPSSADAYAPHGAYTLQGSTLVIDQCSAADGPKYTYTRQ